MISRPTTSFCWFPPDRAVAGTSTLGVFTANLRTISSVCLRDPFLSIQIPLA